MNPVLLSPQVYTVYCSYMHENNIFVSIDQGNIPDFNIMLIIASALGALALMLLVFIIFFCAIYTKRYNISCFIAPYIEFRSSLQRSRNVPWKKPTLHRQSSSAPPCQRHEMMMRNRTEEEGDDTLSEIVHTIENSLDRKLDIGGLACTKHFVSP